MIMTAQAIPAQPVSRTRPHTANDRFHRSFTNLLCLSLILATEVHYLLFSRWPSMMAADVTYDAAELTAIELPPEVKIPEAPSALARPAIPVLATADISEDITIAPTTFESNPVTSLPPPPTLEEAQEHDVSAAPVFTPFTVKPDVKNRAEVQRALEAEYPTLLRDAGLGGTVSVWFFIDQEGQIVRTQLARSSGHPAMDVAALKVAEVIQFTPAMNRDRRVAVWISLPITFTVR